MLAASLAAALLLTAPEPPVPTEGRDMMGTRVTVAISAPPEEAARGFRAAFAVFERVDEVMNEWRPESPLSAINAAAGKKEAPIVPPDLCEVIKASLDGARRTGGLFDPSWAALRDLWKFGSDQTGTPPDPRAVKERCPLVDYKKVHVGSLRDGCKVSLEKPGMKLGLGGIAKGWGVDRAVAALRAAGFKDFFVQAGGDLYAAGKKNGHPWRVGIRDPRGPAEKTFALLEVSDAAFSTSGDYEHFFLVDGVRYHHLIDPRTCQPAKASRSATILAKTAADAEFLTKATFILGGAEGVKLADDWGAAAVLVGSDNKVVFSKSLEGKLTWWQPSP